MNEYPSEHQEKEAKEQKQRDYCITAVELSKRREGFSFPGVTPEGYAGLKADSDAYPEYATPIDELMEKFRTQGMKVVLSKDPTSANVYIIPRESDDVQMDNIYPRHLIVTDDMDYELKKLIILNKELNHS